ncbi:MAG TPA: L-glutamate gamma-semialdehyde dehydrogenase [Candidatus Aminicenantes bacterium]|nr:L-glutamate gamma-semialdehyde dehydrogenase [Candidatus Aminicenantes bacterium]HRY64031.1 L-glutamate gamma-semialdehyde dehydrogenase [Candidatus Aminicenantes bacterium]HRZ70944.1 L-glutamate gamma-semialdehyde dehydrogenase [Candidatus Aminicenantes bacterium]
MEANRCAAPSPDSESVRDYGPGSEDKRRLKEALRRALDHPAEIPLVIGGAEVRTGRTTEIRCPHDLSALLGSYHRAGREEALAAVGAALKAKPAWERTRWQDRAAIFLRAADLLAGRYRHEMVAATMLGQSKNVFQAELDAACELADYLRYNVAFMGRIYADQPDHQAPGTWTRLDYRSLDGFVFAVTPFNFTAIGGNLPTAPAMMGNTAVWKPASTAVLSSALFMRILTEAGLPPGVVNMVPGRGSDVGDPVIDHRDLAGVHFTGSNGTFESIWHRVGVNVKGGVYRNYPRLVGETGGKDFVVAAPDAAPDAVAAALFRGAFEYQGQKCSATSRAYIPRSLWPEIKSRLAEMASAILVGDVADFRTFMGAVIDKPAFDSIVSYIEYARASKEAEIVIGGTYDDGRGYFVRPTVIETSDPRFRTMAEEIFGPVLTVHVYPDGEFERTLDLVDSTSPYALTGAVFSTDREAIRLALERLAHAAGNFYINDKTTGACVGQQPFGGGRMSGTNDKAGSALNLIRWTSPRTIKENFDPPRTIDYPHMAEA